MVWHLTGLEADTFLNGWTVRLAKGPLDGRVRYGKSAAGADALQNLAEIRTRVLIAIASWSAGALSRFRNRKRGR